jgi:hypothetical protein
LYQWTKQETVGFDYILTFLDERADITLLTSLCFMCDVTLWGHCDVLQDIAGRLHCDSVGRAYSMVSNVCLALLLTVAALKSERSL